VRFECFKCFKCFIDLIVNLGTRWRSSSIILYDTAAYANLVSFVGLYIIFSLLSKTASLHSDYNMIGINQIDRTTREGLPYFYQSNLTTFIDSTLLVDNLLFHCLFSHQDSPINNLESQDESVAP